MCLCGWVFVVCEGFFLICGWVFLLLLLFVRIFGVFFPFVLNKCFHLMQALETQGAPTESQKCNCILLTTRRHSWKCGAQSGESRAISPVCLVSQRGNVCADINICHIRHRGCKGKLLVLASWLFGDCKAIGRAGY